MAAADAFRRGDEVSGAALTKAAYQGSQMHAFSFAPFSRFINHLSPGDDAEYLAGLNRWIARDPDSGLAYLLRAKYAYNTAKLIRGPDADRKVTSAHMQAFHEGMAEAEQDIRESIHLDPTNPASHFLWLDIATTGGEKGRMDEAFSQGITRFPDYYPLYELRLLYINESQARHDFVVRHAGKAPDSSPLKLLYLELLVEPERIDSGACGYPTLPALIECVREKVTTPPSAAEDNRAGVTQAFALYHHLDPVEYSNKIWRVLGDMRGHSYAASMLQQAADTMGSDNALIHEPGHNNYALDDITAQVWEGLDNPVNVAQKYQEALDDAHTMSFVSEEDRQEVLATIYDHMAWSARRASRYDRIVAAQDAANAAAGVNHGGSPYLKCFALYKLDRFQEALQECSNLITTHLDVVSGLYYRARAHEGLKQYDAAIADFAPVAENGSENYIRWGAALEMEHVTALQGNFQGQLDIFNKYPWMLDARLQPPEDLAIAYNNRCYAYMNLGHLQQALDDCNVSLKYGQLPDAIRKQSELLKLLHKD